MQTIFTYLFVVSGLTTFSIWIGKLVITRAFDLGVEKYKVSLQKEIEEHKTELSKISLEHQIKFSSLHEERAQTIQVLYGKVIELEMALIFSTTIAQGPEYMTDLKRDDACFEKIRDLIYHLDLKRIYFSPMTISKFDTIVKESWDISFQMRKVRRFAEAIENSVAVGREVPDQYYTEADLWSNAYARTQNEFKILKEDLANEFRGLLGINCN